MRQSRYVQVIATLAFSLFVAYATGQGLGLLFDSLGSVIAFLILAGLLLFVIHYSNTFYKTVVACLFRLSICLFAVVSDLLSVRREHEAGEVSLVPDLPSRFQRPPPIFVL